MNAIRRYFLAACFSALGTAFVAAQAPEDVGLVDADAIEVMYLADKEQIVKPLEELQAKYISALRKAADSFRTEGNLDGVLAVETAVADAEKGNLPDGKSHHANLARFEEVYITQHSDMEKSFEPALRKADKDYVGMMEALSVQLTRAGKTEDALKVRTKAEEIKKKSPLFVITPPTTGDGAPVVKIISARYGTGGKFADVTEKVREMIEVKKKTFWARDFGIDPNPGWNKSVNVKFTKNGIKRERSWGREVPLRVEDFYGPQDQTELQRWMVGSKWRADVEVSFTSEQAFDVMNRLGNYPWSAPERRKILMVWSPNEAVICVFNETWSEFTEQAGKKRTFKKTR